MGYDLSSKKKSKNDYYRFNIWGWGKVLELAEKYGWNPKGTVIEDNTQTLWEGYYTSNDGQLVTDEDVLEIKKALELALGDKDYTKREAKEWISHIEGFTKFLENGAFYIF